MTDSMIAPLKEQYTDKPAKDFYVLIIKCDSFRHLKKTSNDNKYGWDVEVREGFNYETFKTKDVIIVSI